MSDLENRQDSKGTEILSVVLAPPGGPLLHLIESFRKRNRFDSIWFGKDENYFDTLLRKMSKVCENLHEDGSKLCLNVFHEPTYARQRCCPAGLGILNIALKTKLQQMS